MQKSVAKLQQREFNNGKEYFKQQMREAVDKLKKIIKKI